MAIYLCDRCGKYCDDDYEVFHVTKIPGDTEERNTCDTCACELEGKFEDGLIESFELDYEKMTRTPVK